MTLTIEVAPETESCLEAKARQQGLSLPEYARQVLEQDAVVAANGHTAEANAQSTLSSEPLASDKPDRAQRQAATRALRGRLGRVSSEELIRQRREEAAREMQATAAWLERTAAKRAP